MSDARRVGGRHAEPPTGSVPHEHQAAASDSPGAAPGAGPGLPWRRIRPTVIGALIVLLGFALSAFLANEWRSSAAEANKKAFQSDAAYLNSTLDSRLDGDIRLTRTMRAIATLEPQASQTRFTHWYAALQRGTAMRPHVTAELIQPITAAQLPAFRARAESDPTFHALLGGRLRIVPPGKRSVYCVITAIVGVPSALNLSAGLRDYCAPSAARSGRTSIGTLIEEARDTGALTVTRVPSAGARSAVAIGAAVYRAGAPTATLGERRAAVTGAIGTSFDGGALVSSVLGRHRFLALSLYHRNAGGQLLLLGRAGDELRAKDSGYTARRELGEGWLVVASGMTDAPIGANMEGLIALIVGVLITLLILLLYRVLAGSRRRAWGLVGEKTGELAYRALHDPLTDLPNRSLVLDRAEQILARARRLDVPVTALFVDIDGFKQVNDRFGHHAGDEVLRQVGARLKTVLRDNDTVGRLGGDEFIMLVDAIGLNAAPQLVAERILAVLRQPIELGQATQAPLTITASIGIATGLPVSAEALMQDADLALHKAKALGKNGFALFESAMQTVAKDRMQLELDLSDALASEQFFLAFQPMIALQSERVVGVEALLRWRHPTSGVIPPDVFIPIAEENASIVQIGRWVLEQACVQGVAWHKKGYALNISVNVSARQLERTEFVEEVRQALANSHLDPTTLTLEITETVLMRRPDITAQLLSQLKRLGVRIAVDDFGTGYSSLAYLRQFPVDSLKIDRTFITGLALSSEAHALTHTLIQLGKVLGLQTLAEGVEEHSQVRELQREGCDLVQGFLFARPLAPDAVERFLEDTPRLRGAPGDGQALPAGG